MKGEDMETSPDIQDMETSSDVQDKKPLKVTHKRLARILWSIQRKDGDDAEGAQTWEDVRPEMQKTARRLMRQLEKRGITFS